jgi:hypothetical protein
LRSSAGARIDGDPPRRMLEAGVAQRPAHPLARLLEGGVGEPDDCEPWQTRARRRPRPGSPGRRGRRALRTGRSRALRTLPGSPYLRLIPLRAQAR